LTRKKIYNRYVRFDLNYFKSYVLTYEIALRMNRKFLLIQLFKIIIVNNNKFITCH